jgi:hypothetical protein
MRSIERARGKPSTSSDVAASLVATRALNRLCRVIDRWLDVVWWRCDRAVDYFRMPRRLRGLSDEQLAPMHEDFALHGADPRFLAAMSDVVKAARRAKLHNLAAELDQRIDAARSREQRLHRFSPPPRVLHVAPSASPVVQMPSRYESRPGRVRTAAAAGGGDPPDEADDDPPDGLGREPRGLLGTVRWRRW